MRPSSFGLDEVVCAASSKVLYRTRTSCQRRRSLGARRRRYEFQQLIGLLRHHGDVSNCRKRWPCKGFAGRYQKPRHGRGAINVGPVGCSNAEADGPVGCSDAGLDVCIAGAGVVLAWALAADGGGVAVATAEHGAISDGGIAGAIEATSPASAAAIMTGRGWAWAQGGFGRSVLVRSSGRLWAVLGLPCAFALRAGLLRFFAHMFRSGCPCPAHLSWVQDMTHDWGWLLEPDGLLRAPDGELHLESDILPAVLWRARLAWERAFWHGEPRA